jgi:hypothetical protein
MRSNCEFPSVIAAQVTTALQCVRNSANSTFLTARMSDNSHTDTRYLMVAGVAISGQSPLMYKNGW